MKTTTNTNATVNTARTTTATVMLDSRVCYALSEQEAIAATRSAYRSCQTWGWKEKRPRPTYADICAQENGGIDEWN